MYSGPVTLKTWSAERHMNKDLRVSISAAELETVIGQSLKAALGCEGFIGVFVRHKKPESDPDPNWEVRGLRFGNADRESVNEALVMVVARLQQEYQLQR
jgi:hypothetical protein